MNSITSVQIFFNINTKNNVTIQTYFTYYDELNQQINTII